MSNVAYMFDIVLRPYWMPFHRRWANAEPQPIPDWLNDGRAGLVNLAWLTRNDPPTRTYVINYGARLRVQGVTLEEMAATTKLEDFSARLFFSNLPPEVNKLAELSAKESSDAC